MLLLLNYDFTLDESNVERDEKTHQQEFANRNAKAALKSLCKLGGFKGILIAAVALMSRLGRWRDSRKRSSARCGTNLLLSMVHHTHIS